MAKRTTFEPIPAETMTTLRAYARWAGVDWESQLILDWMRAGSRFPGQWGALQDLRNRWGPEWLRTFELPELPPFELPRMAYAQVIPAQVLLDNLCSAFEGGISYWAAGVSQEEPARPEALAAWKADGGYNHALPMFGGSVVLRDCEDPDGDRWTLDAQALTNGVNAMASKYPEHFATMLAKDGDAETGDVFVQCCLFGEIVYG